MAKNLARAWAKALVRALARAWAEVLNDPHRECFSRLRRCQISPKNTFLLFFTIPAGRGLGSLKMHFIRVLRAV